MIRETQGYNRFVTLEGDAEHTLQGEKLPTNRHTTIQKNCVFKI